MEFVHALLEALGNERFIEYVANSLSEEEPEPLYFVVEGLVFHMERKDGKWLLGCYQSKDTLWKMLGKQKMLYISV